MPQWWCYSPSKNIVYSILAGNDVWPVRVTIDENEVLMKSNRAPDIAGNMNGLCLTTLFNQIFHSGGSKQDPSCYCGITLLNSIGKILCKRLKEAEEYGQNHSLVSGTTDCAFVLNAAIESCQEKILPLFACFVDLKKHLIL